MGDDDLHLLHADHPRGRTTGGAGENQPIWRAAAIIVSRGRSDSRRSSVGPSVHSSTVPAAIVRCGVTSTWSPVMLERAVADAGHDLRLLVGRDELLDEHGGRDVGAVHPQRRRAVAPHHEDTTLGHRQQHLRTAEERRRRLGERTAESPFGLGRVDRPEALGDRRVHDERGAVGRDVDDGGRADAQPVRDRVPGGRDRGDEEHDDDHRGGGEDEDSTARPPGCRPTPTRRRCRDGARRCSAPAPGPRRRRCS